MMGSVAGFSEAPEVLVVAGDGFIAGVETLHNMARSLKKTNE